jgi:hypothetical protein
VDIRCRSSGDPDKSRRHRARVRRIRRWVDFESSTAQLDGDGHALHEFIGRRVKPEVRFPIPE